MILIYNNNLKDTLDIYKKILRYNELDFEETDITDPDFWLKLKESEYFIFRWKNSDNELQLYEIITLIAEKYLNIKCFPDINTCWHYDDKVKQYFLLSTNKMPAAESFIFYDREQAMKFLNNTELPIVMKLKKGSGGLNTLLIEKKSIAKRYINRLFGKGIVTDRLGLINFLSVNQGNKLKTFKYFLKNVLNDIGFQDNLPYWQLNKNYILFQKYLKGNSYDTRITTVGNRAHGFIRMNRENDFRASGGEYWDINPEKIDKRMIKIALDTSKKFGFQTMAYDFMLDENRNPVIIEMSYAYGQPGYPDFMNGYWDDELIWHEGRYWPQYFDLIDLLNLKNLVLPKIEIPKSWLKNTIL